MHAVIVTDIEGAGYYASGSVSGSTVKVTLRRGQDIATCDGILIWEDEDEEYLNNVFDEWVEYAKAGEAGYSAVIVEGDSTALYGK